jgi:hypothetical protein
MFSKMDNIYKRVVNYCTFFLGRGMVTTELEKKIIHIWNIYEEEALESTRLCFPTSVLLPSFFLCRQINASSVFFWVANFHNLGRKKNGPCQRYKGIFLKKIGPSHHIVRKKKSKVAIW